MKMIANGKYQKSKDWHDMLGNYYILICLFIKDPLNSIYKQIREANDSLKTTYL